MIWHTLSHMRSLGLVVFLAACGGAAKPASTTPVNDAPDPFPTRTVAEPEAVPAPAPPPPVVDDKQAFCKLHPDDFGPYMLTAEQAATRHGLGATSYAAAPSSKEQPIEVCGVHSSQQWLIAAACADGSHPIKAPAAAARSRAGNVGPGGRCGAFVDRYVVKCPEAAYDVFIDMYMCGPNESF